MTSSGQINAPHLPSCSFSLFLLFPASSNRQGTRGGNNSDLPATATALPTQTLRRTIATPGSDEIDIILPPVPEGNYQAVVNASKVEISISVDGEYTLVIANGTNTNNADFVSTVVDISLLDGSGNYVQPNSTVQICFEVGKNEKDKNVCLGSFQDGKWQCDDHCLKRNNDDLLCGDVDHFTNFALLLTGDAGDCNDDHESYITGDSMGDFLLIMLLIALACVCIICCVAASNFRLCEIIIVGKEGMRVKDTRLRMSEVSK